MGGQEKGQPFIGMNRKDRMLPEQLRSYSNLKEKDGERGVGVKGEDEGQNEGWGVGDGKRVRD